MQSSYYHAWSNRYCHVDIFSDVEDVIVQSRHYLRSYGTYPARRFSVHFVSNAPLYDSLAPFSRGGVIVRAKTDVCYRRVMICEFELFVFLSERAQYLILRRADALLVVARSDFRSSARVPVRIARELALRCAQNTGALFAHAAAASHEGRATLILGGKGAGKSTLCWAMSSRAGYSFIANDRCIVDRRNSVMRVVAWPIAIRLGRGLVERDPEYFGGRALSRAENSEVERRNREGRGFEWGVATKYELTPYEFETIVGAPSVDDAEVGCILMPRLSLDGSAPTLVPADSDAVRRAFISAMNEPEDHNYLRGWLDRRSSPDNEVMEQIAASADYAAGIKGYFVIGDASRLMQDVSLLCDRFR